MNPSSHIRRLKGYSRDEKKSLLEFMVLDYIPTYGDIDVDFINYTKDEYAELCGFSSREVAQEAVERYKALQEECDYEKRVSHI